MAGTFPTLKSGKIDFYGTDLTLSRKTEVLQFVNDTEQRWKSAQALLSAVLTYTEGNFYDLGLLQDFFRTQKGRFDSTWSISIEDPPGTITVYNNMTFDQDDFTYTEDKPNRFSSQLKVRQVQRG